MTYTYLDCETTGLDPDRHEVWEIAYAVEDGPIMSSFVWHTPPTLYIETLQAVRVNGYVHRYQPISLSDSRSFEQDVYDALYGATLVGANPAFDARMLSARWSDDFGDPEPWHYRLLDIEAYAMGVMGWDELRGLSKIAEALGVDQPDHTAAQDVSTLRACFHRLREIRGAA